MLARRTSGSRIEVNPERSAAGAESKDPETVVGIEAVVSLCYVWLVSFMNYDLGYIDLEEKTLQPLENPFGPKV
jgi:hypothetical protein